ncbi:MAG TPA: hypothetical protein VLI05_06075 [Candidatus Saccharimonadia bacterium]|nr:hypothetical protein [Candidatus Saccharimonadia bacterium]
MATLTDPGDLRQDGAPLDEHEQASLDDIIKGFDQTAPEPAAKGAAPTASAPTGSAASPAAPSGTKPKAAPLNPAEQAKLDQIGAGLKHDKGKSGEKGTKSPAGGGPAGPTGPGGANPLAGGAGKGQDSWKKFGKSLWGKRKQVGMGGVIAVVIGLAYAVLLGLAPLKLIHLREVMDQYFGGRQKHMTQYRGGKMWSYVLDKNGNLHYTKATGRPLLDAIHNVNTQNLLNDMKARGMNVSLDPSNHYRVLLNGEPMAASVSDYRSAIRQTLKEVYPDDGFFRRNLRAIRVFHAFGIKLSFFDNVKRKAGEKLTDWLNQFKKEEVRPRLVDANGNPTLEAENKDQNNKADEEATKAINDLNEQLKPDVDKARQDFLDGKPVPPVDTNLPIDGAKILSSGAIESLKGALSVTNELTQVCNIKNLLSEVIVGSQFLRATSEVRWAGIIDVAADQYKVGDKVSSDESEAVNQLVGDMGNSAAFDVATGQNPHAKVDNADKYSTNLAAQGGFTGTLGKLNASLDGIPGGGTLCAVVTNVFFQVGSIGVTLAADFFTGGGISIVGIASSATTSFAIAATTEILKPLAIQMLAGEAVTGDEPGKDKDSAFFAGSDYLYNSLLRRSGGHKLKKVEVDAMNIEIAQEQQQEDARRSLADRLFNLDNPNSVTARFAFALPSSLSAITSSLAQYMASINPFAAGSWVLAPNGLVAHLGGQARALGLPEVGSWDGVGQYGITDAEFDAPPLPPVPGHHADNDPTAQAVDAEESPIIDDPAMLQKYQDVISKCYTPVQVDPADEAGLCDASTDTAVSHMGVYHFERGYASGIELFSGSVQRLPDDEAITPAGQDLPK